jgi:hypothetical protein
MIDETFGSIASLAAAMAIAGLALGLVYFAAMHKTAALFVAGTGWLRPSALTLGRIGAATILLALAAKLGATPLLAAFCGFLVARAIALRVVRND